MPETFRARLRRLMDERGLDMKGLSIAAGLGETAVRDILDRGADPRRKTIEKLSSALGVSSAELIEGADVSYQLVPIIGFVSAGEGWMPFDDDGHAQIDEVELRIEGGEAVGLQVRGQSMAPVYRDGDTLIGAKRTGPRADNLVGLDCIVMTEDGERYVKFLARGQVAGRFNLRSYNPAYADIPNVRLKWAAPIVWVKRSLR
jgi:transcriptional regulator with XRE-family HTH domain